MCGVLLGASHILFNPHFSPAEGGLMTKVASNEQLSTRVLKGLVRFWRYAEFRIKFSGTLPVNVDIELPQVASAFVF